MEIVETFKGHWLEPFRNKITRVEVLLNEVKVSIKSDMEELHLGINKGELEKLGVTHLEVSTPVERYWDDSLNLPSMKHTEEIFITLTIKRSHTPYSTGLVSVISIE